jgi:hypothetical protein
MVVGAPGVIDDMDVSQTPASTAMSFPRTPGLSV